MRDAVISLAEQVALRYAQLPDVETVALAGSQATGTAGDSSDIDIYIYSHHDIDVSVRAGISREFSDSVEVVDYWGPGVEWDDRQTGHHVDVVFFTVAWIEEQIERVLGRHEAALGYTTSFWHTVRISRILFDRAGWFGDLQQRASNDYPQSLVKSIIAINYPVLRRLKASSYMRQLEKAASRGDAVSLNHRTAALLASYFDILFAINRLPHPGEKRLLEYAELRFASRPAGMREDVLALIRAGATPGGAIVEAGNRLLDGLDELLRREGLFPAG